MLWIWMLACSPSVTSEGPPFQLGERQCVAGEVTEVLDAGSYTYIAYTDAEGHPGWWVTLSSSTQPELGEQAHFVQLAQEQDFHSARLERDFSTLGFGFVGPC